VTTPVEDTSAGSAERPGRLATALRRFLFMGVGVVVALLVVEAGLRLFRLAPAQGIATVNAKQYERVPGMFAPNQRVRDLQKPALPYTVTIDSLGFRGSHFSRGKPANQWRIVMLGDSYVYGDFVEDNQTLPFQLQERLRSACHDALVINAGLGGTTIVDQAFMLQRALALAPDLVILLYVFDDFENLGNAKSSWELFAENRLQKSRFPLSVVYPVLRGTALWNLALKARATRLNRDGETALHQAYARDSAETTTHLRNRYGAALLALRDTLKAHGVAFVLAMFPAQSELKEASANLTWMERFAGTHAINAVSLQSAFQASHLQAEQLFLIPEDGHPRPQGYSIAAEAVAERVLGSLAPPSCK